MALHFLVSLGGRADLPQKPIGIYPDLCILAFPGLEFIAVVDLRLDRDLIRDYKPNQIGSVYIDHLASDLAHQGKNFRERSEAPPRLAQQMRLIILDVENDKPICRLSFKGRLPAPGEVFHEILN